MRRQQPKSVRKHPLKLEKFAKSSKLTESTRWTYKELNTPELRTKFEKLCDETNYTLPTQRGMTHYCHIFSDARGSGLEIFLARLQKESMTINYLDGGAGQGCALNDFLTGKIYSIDAAKTAVKATGISLHPFTSIGLLLETHKEKLEWFFARADLILPTLPSNLYDLITDCWGAYYYSVERARILSNYYRLLRPGGNAYIMVGLVRTVGGMTFITGDGGEERYEHYLIRKWPEIFKLRCNPEKYEWLTIYKRPTTTDPEKLDCRCINFKLRAVSGAGETVKIPYLVQFDAT